MTNNIPNTKELLYERVGKPNILSCFVVGRTRSECGLPMAVIPDFLEYRMQ